MNALAMGGEFNVSPQRLTITDLWSRSEALPRIWVIVKSQIAAHIAATFTSCKK